MKKRIKFFSFFLTFATLISCLSSCSQQDPTPDPEPVQPSDELLERPEWAIEEDDLLSFQTEAHYDSNAFSDVKNNFEIELVDNSVEQNIKDPTIYIKVYDT